MAKIRSKTYEGTYNDKNGKTHHFTAKIHDVKRLIAFGLCMTIGASFTGCKIVDVGPSTNLPNPPGIERPKDEATINSDNKAISFVDREYNSTSDPDYEKISAFLYENPHLLETVSTSLYTVQGGESLSTIAQRNGITLARLEKLSGVKRSDMLYEGQEILVETVEDLSEMDKEIKMLESYFFDYVFSSQAAKIADGEIVTYKEQAILNRTILYGDTDKENTFTPQSIKGQVVKAYTNFHDENTIVNDEIKKNYIETLAALATTLDDKLNLGGMAEFIVPYNTFRVFCINGHTNSMEIENNYTTIYG